MKFQNFLSETKLPKTVDVAIHKDIGKETHVWSVNRQKAVTCVYAGPAPVETIIHSEDNLAFLLKELTK